MTTHINQTADNRYIVIGRSDRILGQHTTAYWGLWHTPKGVTGPAAFVASGNVPATSVSVYYGDTGGVIVDTEREGIISRYDVSEATPSNPMLELDPDEVIEPTPDSYVYKIGGIFHTPTTVRPTLTVDDIGVPVGEEYSRLEVSMSFRISDWNSRQPDGIHGLVWLPRDDEEKLGDRWAGNQFCYSNLRGPNRNVFTNYHNADLPRGESRNARSTARLDLGNWHRYRYLYDIGQGLVLAKIIDGVSEVSIADGTTIADTIKCNRKFGLQVGLEDEGHAEVPSIGWEYADLEVKFIR